ncbi:hypothetical protein BpHYR1_039006 [Brachionus plicatilis]|uniref:Uncharacterized protein n=1 Tax=Brachionus plicatilis TaxID=10195 RepID=A0A3M7T1A7_BRAPC|nr:hypothetical protein BpHYR1_039006 [Brachionus plicatilis]
MNGCTRSMIQSYIDEYVWRYNNNCTTNREKSYELILHEIAKNYNPGQALRDFEEKYEKCVPTDNEYFDFDSQSESGSETNLENDLENLENSENMAKENAEDIYTDDEDKKIVSNLPNNQLKILSITKKIDELSSDLKKKAVLCEIRSLELPKNSSKPIELLKRL